MHDRISWPGVALLACLMACNLFSAPLPPAKQPPAPLREAIIGRFTLHWGGGVYECEIDRDYCWDCRAGGVRWIGGVEVRGDRVTLSEAILDPLTLTTGEERHYEIELGPDLTGRVVDGVSVRLERRLGPVE